MHALKIVVVLLLLPALWTMLSNRSLKREHAIALLGFSFFLSGDYSLDAALVSWPVWPAPTKGVIVSATDCLSWALILSRPQPFKNIRLKGVFVGFAAAVAFSIPLSPMPMASFFVLWQAVMVFGIFIAIAGEVADLRNLRYLMVGVSYGLMLEAFLVASEKAKGVVQAAGSMSHPNVLAIMVELSVPPILALLLDGGRQKALWVGVASGLFVLAGGGSRAGLMLGGLAVLLTLILSVSHSITSRKTTVLGLVALTLAVATPVAYMTLSKRFGETSVFAEEDQRAALERTASIMSADHPLGVGANVFVSVANMAGYYVRGNVAWSAGNRTAPVHNTYLLMKAELGYQGLTAWILLIGIPILVGIRSSFKAKQIAGSGVLLGSVAGLVALSVHSFYEWAPVTYSCLALLALNVAIIGGFNKRVEMLNGRAGAQRERVPSIPIAHQHRVGISS